MKSINEIQNELNRLGELIGVTKEDLLIGYPLSDPVVDVEIHGDEYHYVVIERGVERKRIQTRLASELMYLFLKDATSSMASDYASKNRKKENNFRLLAFKRQLELLHKVNPDWANQRQKEITEIMRSHPDNKD